jgi:hypothetical protein
MNDKAATFAGQDRRARARAAGGVPVAGLGVGAILLAIGAPAEARVGDRDWAQCVWQTAPVSAQNWLSMRAPVWSDNMATPAELLGHRLIAVCSTEAADERRPNRNPNWNRLMIAVRNARPDAPASSEGNAPTVSFCRNQIRVGDRDSTYRVDITRRAGEGQLIVFQQYFTEHQGQSLRMPQDLRALPPAGAQLSVECRAITSSGGLADA